MSYNDIMAFLGLMKQNYQKEPICIIFSDFTTLVKSQFLFIYVELIFKITCGQDKEVHNTRQSYPLAFTKINFTLIETKKKKTW